LNDTVFDAALVRWLGEFAEQGIFTTDERLRITSWNQWMEHHSGREAAEVMGRPLPELYPDLTERGLDEHYREALQGHSYLVSRLLHGYLLPMIPRAAEPFFASMPQRARIAPLMLDDRVIGTITVIDDVSERVAAENELRKQIEAQQTARAAAEAALRVKDDFLATLSHEIRQPLNAVLGWARLLGDRRLDPDMRAHGIEVIERNTTLQARMIDDLLDTARVVAGKLRLQMQPVDLLTIAGAALEVVGPAAEAKDIAINKFLDPSLPRVLGDPDRLQQVLWNLLSNAVKFTDKGGTIDVRIERAGEACRITVGDTGRGIDPGFLPHVFERFRQAEGGMSRESGLGIGLALVKELVSLHGGTITASSPGSDCGSTFVVTIPLLRSGDEAPVTD